MSRKKDIDLDLTGFAELFMNDEGRAESRLPRIYDIPLSEIDDFPNHPFKVKMDEDMNQLVQSVKERGIITPITLHHQNDSLISGQLLDFCGNAIQSCQFTSLSPSMP